MTYLCSAYLKGGYDMAFIAIEFNALGRIPAERMFHAAMVQLGFKVTDYGAVAVSPV